MYYLDATALEEAATPLRLLLMYSAPAHAAPRLQGMRLLGSGEVNLALIKTLTSVCAIACRYPYGGLKPSTVCSRIRC